MKNLLPLLLFGFLFWSCKNDTNTKKTETPASIEKEASKPSTENTKITSTVKSEVVFESEELTIKKLTPHVFVHISYLTTKKYGKVPSNGMIALNKNEAIIFDTPASIKASNTLIKFVQNKLKATIKAVVPTHFHADCTAGIGSFIKAKIPVYAYQKTIDLLRENNNEYYSIIGGFKGVLALDIGGKKIYAIYFGEGHTKDNIVIYFPAEKTLFGGCLIKEIGAEKGNLADANLAAWPKTIDKLLKKYPDLQFVIPGHGKSGGTELLTYTYKLFK